MQPLSAPIRSMPSISPTMMLHSLSPSLSPCPCPSHSAAPSNTHTHINTNELTHMHTCTHPSLTFSLSHILSLSLSHTHSHTHTYTYTHTHTGIVRGAADCTEVISAKLGGKVLFKRDLTVFDGSNTEVRLTLWGDRGKCVCPSCSIRVI
jgi:Replication protein A OB domain